MAATSSEAAAEAHATSMLVASIQQYCRKIDEDYKERVRMRALMAGSLPIWDILKQFPQFSHEAECHIEGAMQDPAEPPSAADAEPPEAPDAEPPLLADLAQEFLGAPEAPEAQADTFWNDWPDLTEQFEETPEAPPGPPSSEHAEPTEFLYADANWDDWELPGMASSNTTSEAEQISKAQSSQPAHQHSLQHQQHKREKSANYWRHNTPTTGAAAERRNKRKHAQMKHPERRTLHNKKKKVRQMFNNLWITMHQTISENVSLPQQYWREKNRTDSAVTMEERKAGIEFMNTIFGHSQH